MSDFTAHIERLRRVEPLTAFVPTAEEMTRICEDFFDTVPCQTTLQRAELRRYDRDQLIKVLEDFGKFRARTTFKEQTKADFVHFDELSLTDLFWMSRSDLLRMAEAARRYRQITATVDDNGNRGRWKPTAGDPTAKEIRNWMAYADEAFLADVPAVVIPDGYSPGQLGRDIRPSLVSVGRSLPTAEEIDRFLTRTYSVPEPILCAEHVYLVWWLAAHGLGAKLDELDGTTDYLNRLLVEAYDLLDIQLRDARRAVEELVEGAEDAPPAQLRTWTDTASWLHPGLFDRVTGVIDTLETSDSARGRSYLRSRVDTVDRWARAGQVDLHDIGSLNEGQVRLLLSRSGMEVEAAEERKMREQIRSRLIAAGLENDLDRDIPAGLTAWRLGTLDSFWEQVDTRAKAAKKQVVTQA